jgi:hypothetical protein
MLMVMVMKEIFLIVCATVIVCVLCMRCTIITTICVVVLCAKAEIKEEKYALEIIDKKTSNKKVTSFSCEFIFSLSRNKDSSARSLKISSASLASSFPIVEA